MLTLAELKEALKLAEETVDLVHTELGYCIGCPCDSSDDEDHEPDCRCVRVRDALQRAIDEHKK